MAENCIREFYHELDDFELDMPGRQKVPFRDNNNLLKMLRCQYSNWEDEGRITSVPTARIPRLFLRNIQMSSALQKEFKSLQKGEEGEIKIYRLLMENDDKYRSGVMMFPNVNGREIFSTPSAQVEIDTILAIPVKGVFLFNIKAQGGKGLTPQKIQEDFIKHSAFLRMLMQYGYESTSEFPPIHLVYCHLFDDNKSKFERNINLDQNGGKLLVFSKTDLKVENFTASWNQKMDLVPDIDPNLWEKFEVFVARLVALNSIEGSLALIHDQVSSHYIQATNKNKMNFDDFVNNGDTETVKILKDASLAEYRFKQNNKDNKRFIMWTSDQLKIISTVVEHLQDPSREGLRLLVKGCKGSGKTMLLVFLAKIAAKIFAMQNLDQDCRGKVVVYSGNWISFHCHSEQLHHFLASSGDSICNVG